MTFKPGDKVHVVTAVSSAVVLEQAGDLVYVELPNGVEMEYDASAIIYEDDYVSTEELVEILKEEELTKVWDAIDPKLQKLTKIYHQDITKILDTIGPDAPDPKTVKTWGQVPCRKRLNVLAVLTAVPVAMWKDAYDNDKMSRLTMAAYIGIAKHYEANSYSSGE